MILYSIAWSVSEKPGSQAILPLARANKEVYIFRSKLKLGIMLVRSARRFAGHSGRGTRKWTSVFDASSFRSVTSRNGIATTADSDFLSSWRQYSVATSFKSQGILRQGVAENVEAAHIPADISADELVVNPSAFLKPKPALDASKLRFGAEYTDHMMQIRWKEGLGWSNPRIEPFGPIPIHPCAQVLHYGMECFEGMKAFKGKDGRIRLFRPDLNMERLHGSATRLGFPSFDKEALLDCIKALVLVERDWVPDKDGFSLYIRPTIISTHPHLGVGPPREAMIFCVLSPVGPYYPTGLKPVRLFVDRKHVRAFPGGIGDAKVGGNYAPTILPQLKAAQRGCSQVLYVLDDGRDGGAIGESGAMNVFFLFKKDDDSLELVTPPLDGVILPGVTRDTVLALTRSFGNIKVSERRLSWNEVEEAGLQGSILEIFGTGTACMIQPIIGLVKEDNTEITLSFDHDAASYWLSKPQGSSTNANADGSEPFNLCGRLTRTILDIQYGHSSSSWSVVLGE
ncbi:hypothetical protein R1flu_008829 [Riccia fluitans]|uniref:Branched-chain-amino-acid aminotransferase n=1 Tax=Riccia fluitans TaxID=41844 RepID=A0ABD1Z3D7_9MARC